MLGACVHSAWFMLLAGRVLNASLDLVGNASKSPPPSMPTNEWSSTNADGHTVPPSLHHFQAQQLESNELWSHSTYTAYAATIGTKKSKGGA